MQNLTGEHLFAFVGCWELRERLGRSVRDERQLLAEGDDRKRQMIPPQPIRNIQQG